MSSSARSTQILLVGGTALLTAALYLAPQFKSESHPEKAPGQYSFESALLQAKSALGTQDAAGIAGIEKEAAAHPDNLLWLDSLTHLWDARKLPAIAAYYAEQKAVKDQNEKSWEQAA